MTARRSKRRTVRSSLVARATAQRYHAHLSACLLIMSVLCLEPIESGFFRSEAPEATIRQQPLMRMAGPPQSPINSAQSRQVGQQQQQQLRDYPMQQAQNYPMQPNYPLNEQPIRQRQPPPGQYAPVPLPAQPPTGQQQQQPQPQLPLPPSPPKPLKFKPSKSDPCGAINISEMHGYQVREYKVRTKDNYELVMHRLIHPSDLARMVRDNLGPDGRPPDENTLRRIEPRLGDKKPYLLLHGLVGSSASFVRNVDKLYEAPAETYDVGPEVEAILRKRAQDNELYWQSTADRLNAAFEGDTSNTLESLSFAQKLTKSYTRRTFAKTKLLDFYGDRTNFATEFTQAFRKFDLPRAALNKGKFVPNSLAFTLSNFGYDVWLVNLRGNEYSRGFNGPLNPNLAEYWDFDLDRLVKEDLLASINQVKKVLGWKPNEPHKTLGLVTYSYSSLHVLALLTKFPQYQASLQPVIMMAPTLLSSSARSSKLKFIIKRASQFLISHTGPFPNRAEKKKISIEGIICRLPVASKLCNLMTIILNGKSQSMKDIMTDDREKALMLRDSQCGQTSTGVLHQIVENISHFAVLPKYTPYVGLRDKLSRGHLRRSVMIIRSQADEISTEAEADRIKEASIKGMALSEVVIEEPKFGHTDFLFSKKNQFLVNAEVARMALVFDYVSRRDSASN